MHQLSVVTYLAYCLRYSRSCLFEEERRPSKQVSDMLEGPTTRLQNGRRLHCPSGQTFTASCWGVSITSLHMVR